MNDRELLELAAKAASVNLHGWTYAEGSGFWTYASLHDDLVKWWNPLGDDGDALRLAVKCRIFFDLTWTPGGVLAETEGFSCYERCDAHGGDEMAATRRAIVRAAAAIGQSGADGREG